MTELDALLARSRSPGKFVERRTFTLSRDKAIEKLREFTLPNEAQYILELVQAAVFADADWIAIDVRPSVVTFGWCGGDVLTRRDLEQLFDHLFVAQSDDRKRHVVQVAVAVNALLQERPRLLRIESGDGTLDGSVRMDLDEDGAGVVGTPEGGMAGTYIHVRRRGALLRRLDHPIPLEVQAVEERCTHCPVPILLNGSAPFGYQAHRTIPLHGRRHVHRFDQEGRYGAFGWIRGSAGIRVVVGGVWVVSRPMEALWGGADKLSGVVCDDGLRKTADQSDIVEDDRWFDMLRAVAPAAERSVRERLWGRGADGASWKRPPIVDPRTVSVSKQPGPPAPVDSRGDTVEAAPVQAPDEPARTPRRPGPPARTGPHTPLRQAAGRAPMSHAGMRMLPAGRPVFTVRADSDLARSAAIAPDVFPHPVLLLEADDHEHLRAVFRGVNFRALKTEEEVAFVANALRSADESIEVMLPWQGPGELRLRVHLRGHAPCWGDPADGDVPLLVEAGVGAVRALRTARLGLGVEGLSVHLRHVSRDQLGVLSRLSRLELPVRAALTTLATACIPKSYDEDPEVSKAARALIGAATAVHARPWFVHDGDAVRVRAALPPGASSEALLTTPLLPSGGARLGLAEWIRLVGTDEVLPLDTETVPEWVEAIEARFGFGHLSTPILRTRAVLALALVGNRWAPCVVRRGNIPMLATGLIVVTATLDPSAKTWNQAYPGPRPWKRVHFDIPGLLLLRRGEVAGDPWAEGLTQTFEHVDKALRSRGTPPQGISAARARGLLRRVGLELAVRRRDAPWKRILEASTPVSVHAAISAGTFRVAPAGKLGSDSEPVVGMTLDEVRALHERGHRLRLRFDDEPEVWESLSNDDDRAAWIAVTDIEAGGMKARIGLRRPFDPTAGVITWSHAVPHALPDPIEGLPVHGVVQLEGARTELMTHQWARLKTGVLRLYDSVKEASNRRMDPEDAEAYAKYTELLLSARRRAEEAPEAMPPARPVPLAKPEKRPLSRSAALERDIQDRLGTGVLRSGVTPVMVVQGSEVPVGPGPVARALGLQRGHPLVKAALGGDRRAIDLLTLEAARVGLSGGNAVDPVGELLALHRRVLSRS